MQGKIAFEEHFAIEETLGETRAFAGDSGRWDAFTAEILDLGATRLGFMDDAGIELAVLSLHAPGIQGIVDPQEALAVARKANVYCSTRPRGRLPRHPRTSPNPPGRR